MRLRYTKRLAGMMGTFMLLAACLSTADALERDRVGTISVSNLLETDLFLGVNEDLNRVTVSTLESEDLKYRVPEGGELSLRIGEGSYQMTWEHANRPVAVRIRRNETTTLSLQQGGMRGRDAMAFVIRDGRIERKSLVKVDYADEARLAQLRAEEDEQAERERREELRRRDADDDTGALHITNRDNKTYSLALNVREQTIHVYDRSVRDTTTDIRQGDTLGWTVPDGAYELEWLDGGRTIIVPVKEGEVTEITLDRDRHDDLVAEIRQDGRYKGSSTVRENVSRVVVRRVNPTLLYDSPVIVRRRYVTPTIRYYHRPRYHRSYPGPKVKTTVIKPFPGHPTVIVKESHSRAPYCSVHRLNHTCSTRRHPVVIKKTTRHHPDKGVTIFFGAKHVHSSVFQTHDDYCRR